MALNNIELSPPLLADLYGDSLVATGVPASVEDRHTVQITTAGTPEEESKHFKFLGNNQCQILILVSNPDKVFMPDDELTFLTGILGACKLSLADVAIVNMHHYSGNSYQEITHFLKSRITLLFGIEPASFGLPVSFPFYQLQAFAGNTFLYAPPLKQLENDKVEKSKLWVCLKRLLNL